MESKNNDNDFDKRVFNVLVPFVFVALVSVKQDENNTEIFSPWLSPYLMEGTF